MRMRWRSFVIRLLILTWLAVVVLLIALTIATGSAWLIVVVSLALNGPFWWLRLRWRCGSVTTFTGAWDSSAWRDSPK